MRYGTYTCGLASGSVEYGFTFGEVGNEDDANTTGPCEIGDVEFDIVLGVALDSEQLDEIDAKWKKYKWVAEAIIVASKLGDEVEVPDELNGENAP